MADNYFLAKKTDAKIMAAQVEKLEKVATATAADHAGTATGDNADEVNEVIACLVFLYIRSSLKNLLKICTPSELAIVKRTIGIDVFIIVK